MTGASLTMSSGARHSVGMTINAAFRPPSVLLVGEKRKWPLAMNEDLSAEGHPALWIAAPGPETARRRFTTTNDLVAIGEAAGYNAWARSQGYATRAYRRRRPFLIPFNMGRRSLCRVGGIVVRGAPAWMLSRVTNLWALPGLERNLRILIDWLLDIPFRNDIAVLAPDQTERLQRRHFEAGDDVIVQGEAGDMAYVVESGRLEVLRDGRKVAELSDGECFGEIALLANVPRTATVRCLTPCELTAIGRDDLKTLAQRTNALAEAIRKQAQRQVLGEDALD